jgi:3-oxoacyl-[acyl-carrier protein] reductase
MSKLANQVALITGAARGLGRAYALRIAALGAHVAVLDRSLTSYTEFEAEQRQMTGATTVDEVTKLGVESIGIEADVGDPDAMQTAVRQVEARWGRIDVLVCNAGGSLYGRNRASDLDIAEMNEVLRRNLLGTIHTALAVAPIMKRQRSGKIITVSSQAGSAGSMDGANAHYGVAKAGIVMYTRYLAQDLGPFGVTANCIAPGYIGTGRLMERFERMGVETIESRIALRRLGTAEDCARVVEFLATDLSDYVTGAVIPIDGGSTRWAG